MKNFKLIAIIIFCFLSIKTNAQLITFNKTIDTLNKYNVQNIDTINSSNSGFPNTISKTISNKSVLVIINYQKIDNSGYPYSAYTKQTRYDSVLILKYKMSGELFWSKKYKLNNAGVINDFVETSDNGFMLIGDIGTNNSIIRLDSIGNIAFVKNYANTDSLLILEQIEKTNDNNYVIKSNREREEYFDDCFFTFATYVHAQNYITKINSIGNIIWNNEITNNHLIYSGLLSTRYIPKYLTKLELLNDANNTINIISFKKESYDSILKLKLYQLNQNGIVANETLLIDSIYDIRCSNDIRSYGALISNYKNGYLISQFSQDSINQPYRIRTFFTRNGIASDTVYSNLTTNQLTEDIFHNYYPNIIGLNFTNDYTYSINGHNSFLSKTTNEYDYLLKKIDAKYNTVYEEEIDDNTIIGASQIISTSEWISTKPFALTAINDSTLFYGSIVNLDNKTRAIKFYNLSLKANQLYYTMYIDRNNNGLHDASDSIFYDCFIELENGTSVTNYTPYYQIGNYSKFVPAGIYTSKLVSYSHALAYYTIEPTTKVSVFNNINEIDSVFFRLVPKPNIQDLQVSIVPITIARPGFTSSYKIIAKNVGTKMMYLPTVKFIKDSLQTFTDSTTYAFENDTLFWQIDSLSLLEQREITISLLNEIPPTLNANDTLHLTAQILPLENDSFVQDNYASLNQIVRNSVDPNDKIETHGGNIPYSAVQNREYLYYTIRFQNTGNSYATRIVITDTLTQNVDATTFEFLSSSVPFVMNVVDRKYITWTASNTYLPDSIADEPNSHGYISFRIKPKAGLLPSDEITNRANIVFDYNAAISTNTCTTNIIEQRILSVKNNEIKSIHLFPNPTNGNVQLSMNLLQNKNYTLRIIDINGNLLSNETLKGNAGENNTSINLSNYANGLYFIQLADETGNLFYGKVVKQ